MRYKTKTSNHQQIARPYCSSAPQLIRYDGSLPYEILETVLQRTVIVFLLIYHNLCFNIFDQTDFMVAQLLP
jgi:hypothetical protein